MAKSATYNAWISAIRLRTLPLALASIAMGSFLAASIHRFDWTVFWLASLTTLFLQILSNLANDYGDSIHGADSYERKGPSRLVQSGKITARAMMTAILITAFLALTSGVSLLYYVFSEMNSMFAVFLFLGIGAILAAMGYTIGNKPYGYAGLGDLFVLLFFGLAGVLGTYYLHTGSLDWTRLLPALSSGFFATAVLNVNNIRDMESDLRAGKKSIPVRLGRKKAIQYHSFLIFGGFISALVYVLIHFENLTQFMFIFSLPLFIQNIREVSSKTDPVLLDPSLKKLALSTLLFTLLFGFGLLI